MAGRNGVQTFSHNTRLSASAMKNSGAAAPSNSGDSSSCLTSNSARLSNETPSCGGRAKRERSPERPDTSCSKGGAVLRGKRRFVGVRQRPSGRWVSEIKDTTQKIRLWLGTFDTAEEAARAYDEAAWLIRGANTRTNFVAPSKIDNSALPSKAARLLLRKNAIAAAAAAAAKLGGPEENTSKLAQQQQQKMQSLSESLLARASASAEPQRATPLSVHFLPPAPAGAAPTPCRKLFQRPQTEIQYGAPPAVMKSPACSTAAVVQRDMGFGSVKVERSQPVTVDHHTKERCGALEMKHCIGLSSNNNSSQGFSVTEEMCNREIIPMHKSSAVSRDGEKPSYTNCTDGVRESYSNNHNGSASGFQVQEDHKGSTVLAHQESFDTDISSALSGLEDVDLGCVDSDFDFAAEMSMACGDNDPSRIINLDSLFEGNMATFSTVAGNGVNGCVSSEAEAAVVANDDSDIFSEQMRRMMFGRQRSGGLSAMNGVQECLMLYNNSSPAPYCMSSPSLSLPQSVTKSQNFPFQSSNMSQGWTQHSNQKQEPNQFMSNIVGGNHAVMNSNVYSECGTFLSDNYRTSTNNVGTEQFTHGGSSELLHQWGMGPEILSPEALWNSWELPPLCPVT